MGLSYLSNENDGGEQNDYTIIPNPLGSPYSDTSSDIICNVLKCF